MAIIRIYGDPILRKKSLAITKFDDKLKEFVEKLEETMYESDGVGLAAPQIGESLRVIIVDPTAGEQKPCVLINPDIFYFSEKKEDYEEGCLSIPNISLPINRSSIISVRAKDVNGQEFTLKEVDGLLARVIQHETDHLDGILFVDRASLVRRQLISGKLKKLAKSQKEF